MRGRVRKEAVGVALFPFLAGLICTMGTLIVLLVLLVQQAQVVAGAQAEPPLADGSAQTLQAIEDAHWRREVLEEQRLKKQQELANKRLELAHVEDHIRRLEDSMRQLMAQVKELEEGTSAGDDLESLAHQLGELRRQIADKQAELDAKRQELARRKNSYTLIPYHGRNGTRRLPLYVECTELGVTIQPEGVLLMVDDFQWLGPGNPLDAALRAKRQHLAKVTGGQGGEPYPLLVVRPSGVIAYQLARAAMKSWDDEFGYELVAEDLPLDFGQRDPKLDQLLQKAINDARRRQSLLAASIPRELKQTDLLPSFSPADLPESVLTMQAGGPGRGVGAGGGGTGIGRSEKFADGRAAPAHATAGQPPEPAAPGETTKLQHGAGKRQTSVKDGVAGAKSGKGTPPGTMVRRRGVNWGLPAAQGKTFAVARPIRVACQADRLAILPDRGEPGAVEEFSIGAELTAADVETLVKAIQKRIQGWGLAAENGYWKPELHVEVAPDAERRLEELRAALQGSGIEVHRKNTP
jgi:hypothetical protein